MYGLALHQNPHLSNPSFFLLQIKSMLDPKEEVE